MELRIGEMEEKEKMGEIGEIGEIGEMGERVVFSKIKDIKEFLKRKDLPYVECSFNIIEVESRDDKFYLNTYVPEGLTYKFLE